MSDEFKQANRDDLMKLRGVAPREMYDLPGIGRVWIFGLSHLEAKQWYAQQRSDSAEASGPDMYADARMIVKSVRDESGKPLFTASDVTLIVEWPECIVQDLLRICMRVNGIGEQASAELRKNFATILGVGSVSA